VSVSFDRDFDPVFLPDDSALRRVTPSPQPSCAMRKKSAYNPPAQNPMKQFLLVLAVIGSFRQTSPWITTWKAYNSRAPGATEMGAILHVD
jgi:hypothetical protein